jgi:hypothetical protein
MNLMDIHIHVTGPVTVNYGLPDEDREFLRGSLTSLLEGQSKMSGELDTLTTEVAEMSGVVDSAIALIQGLKAQLDAAGTDPVKLKALSDALDSKARQLGDAVAANTPSAPA